MRVSVIAHMSWQHWVNEHAPDGREKSLAITIWRSRLLGERRYCEGVGNEQAASLPSRPTINIGETEAKR